MSETASYSKNRVMRTLEGALWVEHRFAVTKSSWSNGLCKWMMREVVRALKVILQEERGAILASGWTWCQRSNRKVAIAVEAQQRLHKVIEERLEKNRERQWQAASSGQLTNFAVGDYVMVARVRRLGSTPKLVST